MHLSTYLLIICLLGQPVIWFFTHSSHSSIQPVCHLLLLSSSHSFTQPVTSFSTHHPIPSPNLPPVFPLIIPFLHPTYHQFFHSSSHSFTQPITSFSTHHPITSPNLSPIFLLITLFLQPTCPSPVCSLIESFATFLQSTCSFFPPFTHLRYCY